MGAARGVGEEVAEGEGAGAASGGEGRCVRVRRSVMTGLGVQSSGRWASREGVEEDEALLEALQRADGGEELGAGGEVDGVGEGDDGAGGRDGRGAGGVFKEVGAWRDGRWKRW